MPVPAPSGPISAAQEWRRHGLLVLAGMFGLSVGTLPTATLGLFMQPLSDEFGWSRTEVSIGLTIFALVSLPLTPLAGMLVDRFGARRIAVPGLLISGTCFAAFSLMSGAYVQWLLLWVLYTLASLMTRTLVWSSSISAAFTKSRGLAIAVMLCGTAIATALGPTVTRLLIAEWGWRGAYIGLGLGWAGLAFVLALVFFQDVRRPVERTASSARVAISELPGGLLLREAVRSLTMQRIALAIFIQSVMGTAIMVHIVPMLTTDGLTLTQATTVAALLGLASITGKLATGWLIDRFGAGLLPSMAFAGPGLAYALLLQASGSIWLLSGAVFLLGYCSGAAIQLATYLTTRYAGLRNFGAIFGVLSSLMAGAAGVGPLLAGQIFDLSGSYTLLLIAGVPVSLMAGLSVFRLGPFPVFDPVTPPTPLAGKPATAR